MKSLLRISILALFAAGVLSACDDQTVYHSYQSVPEKGWGKSDTLFFDVPVYDSLDILRLSTGVRNGNNYPYQDLYLFVSHNLEDSTRWQTDTLKFVLSDKEGKWIGTGWGNLYQSTQPLRSAIIRHPGNYTIKVAHGMKDETLNGINDIGIKIER